MITLQDDLIVERKQELQIIFEELEYYIKKEEISDNGFGTN